MKKKIKLKHILIILTSLSLIITIGGGLYEHMTHIPIWTSAPPRSLSMFQGEYGMNAANFWKTIHPITFSLMIISLVLNWKNQSGKYLLIVFAGMIITGIITATYFVPELLSIIQHNYSNEIIPELQQRASMWEKLSLIRLAFIFVMAIVLQIALIRSVTDK